MKLAMAQMLVEGGRPERNLARAADMIREAARRGCDAILLPETLDFGWWDDSARDGARPVPGPSSDALAAAARESGLFVVAGITERDGARIHNASVLLSPRGEILLRHRKVTILAKDLYTPGRTLAVADTPFGTVGIPICADLWESTPALGEALAMLGAKVLLSPSAWAVDADHDNARQPYGGEWERSYTALAKKHRVAVVGVSNVGRIRTGPWKDKKCIGCSLAVGADGTVLARGAYGEAVEMMIEAAL